MKLNRNVRWGIPGAICGFIIMFFIQLPFHIEKFTTYLIGQLIALAIAAVVLMCLNIYLNYRDSKSDESMPPL